jgi:hypothetical protein
MEDLMNARLLWLVGLALTSNISVLGQSKRGPLEGVWQVAEVTRGGPAGAMTSQPGPNLTIFAAKHYSRIDVHTQKPRPALANPATATAEELREVWGPLVAEAGTYELTDTLLALRPIVAKNPAAMESQASIVYSFKLENNILILTAERDQNGPVANPFKVKLVRIE